MGSPWLDLFFTLADIRLGPILLIERREAAGSADTEGHRDQSEGGRGLGLSQSQGIKSNSSDRTHPRQFPAVAVD